MNRPTRIISGGQTGVDQAALRAAWVADIPTGGYAPRGWLTEEGPAPWLAVYGLKEHSSPLYPPRTKANIFDSHATLILVPNIPLTGETKRTYLIAYAAGQDGRGLYVVDLRHDMLADCLEWLWECLGKDTKCGGVPGFILHVTGPRESKAPGIGALALAFLQDLFARLSSPPLLSPDDDTEEYHAPDLGGEG